MDSIGEEILREILLKLPTRDVARCRCVCRLWRVVLTDQYFVNIHHAHATHVISGGGAVEALLISQTKPQGMTVETTVYSVSSGKMMCHVTGLAASYVPANICNGFILYASSDGCWPLFVCNPVTGENIKIPPAPAPPPYVEVERTQYVFAMGFSASTGQYKLFRLPFGNPKTVGNNYLDVHTLGSGGGGWRRHPELFRYHGFGSPPVLVGDKLYVLIKPDVYSHMPDMILVIDVTSEAYHRYHLMPNNNEGFVVAMDVLELGGQPCVAVHVLDLHDHAKITLHIWAMPTPKLVQEGQQKKLHERLPGEWELRYSFYGDMPDNYSFNDEMRAVWVEDDATLCCIMSDRRYQSDTTNIHKDKSKCKVGSLAWNHQLQLPSPPDDLFRRRSINGGYRPTLLSPRDLIVEQHDLAAQRFDNSWLCALRYQRSGKRNGSPCSDHDGDDQHAAKRIHP